MGELNLASGSALDAENDQPLLAPQKVVYRGEEKTVQANLHGVWASQRAQMYWRDLSTEDRAAVMELFGDGVLRDLLEIPVARQIVRKDNRLSVA